MTEEQKFEFSEDSWRHKEPESHKEIVLRAVEECRKQLSKDLRLGGTYNVQTPKGVLPVYFPDQRELNMNTIETLYDLMIWYFDEEANKKFKEIKGNINGAYEKYFQEYLEREYSEGYKQMAVKSRIIQKGKHSLVGEEIESQMGKYILQQYRRLFQELVLLFKRKNELSGKRKIGYD